ncbi:hypothetical protein PHYC_03763 [Phycisphaerales bacterium]|nr:hypothetical protein PHYC_03763 [Phycisphaerales bacterium]
MRYSTHISIRGVGVVVAVVLGVVVGGCSWARQARPEVAYSTAAAEARVGQVGRTELLVAYAKSKVQDDRLRAMVRERDAAKARGDSARVKELEREGSAMQDRAHRQLAGREPLTNVIDAIRNGLPGVAREQHVDRIDIVAKVRPTEASPDVTKAVTALLPRAR